MLKYLLLTALCLCSFQLLSGHGGQITVPTDYVVPNPGPGPAPPGVFGPGPMRAPGPAGPGAKAAAGSPGNPGMTHSMIPTASGSSSQTGRKSIPKAGYERWEFWWECNKDAFLNLKDRLQNVEIISGSSSFFVGRGKKEDATFSRRPTPEIIRNEMLPSLLKMIKIDHPDILDSAPLALARITRQEFSADIFTHIKSLLGNPYASAIQSSVLSLGVLGSPLAAPDLYELMIDSEKGRSLVARHEVPAMVRCFAAISLGMLNPSGGVDKLLTLIQRAPERDRDLKACGILALGLMKNNFDKDRAVAYLVGLLSDKKLDPMVRAQVPVALGRLGDKAALRSLVMAFKADESPALFRQSCAIGLGMLAGLENEETVHLLQAYIKEGRDEQTRHFSFMALAQIGARDEDFKAHQEAHYDLHNFLQREITKPCRYTHRPWAVLAAAIHARKHQPLQGDLIPRIAWYFDDQSDPSCKGAMAIALGLLNARSAAPQLLDALQRHHDACLKGYLCVALGLMNYREATEKIREIAATEIASWGLRLQSVIGLGLLGDTGAVELLV
ncbi:MAG: HEAT repeat domain-containing protein, partial [Planctomycetes bacterium]|nr:HEAT repeat domain-containing protein [Planctomycetota bacterium]